MALQTAFWPSNETVNRSLRIYASLLATCDSMKQTRRCDEGLDRLEIRRSANVKRVPSRRPHHSDWGGHRVPMAEPFQPLALGDPSPGVSDGDPSHRPNKEVPQQ